MTGKVFLKQKLDIIISQEDTALIGVKRIQFKQKFIPLAAEVIPVCKQRKSKDFELAQHLKYLLEKNEHGIFGNIEITGKMDLFHFFKDSVERPSETETGSATRLDISLKGDFPWFLNKLHNEGSCASFEIYLENLIAVNGKKSLVFTLSKLKNCSSAKTLANECVHLSYMDAYTEFSLNAATWDFLFQPKAKGMKSPKLSFVVCANISERMAQSLLIVSPKGSYYLHTPYHNKIRNERQHEIAGGTQPDTVIVGQSGKEWSVQSKYLIDGSPVFEAMLEKPNFEEGRTKRVNLSDLEDKAVDCLVQYLYWFNMTECLNDFGMAIRMLEVADRFQITGLTKALEEMLIRRSNISPPDAIQLFSYVRRLDHFHLLKHKALVILYQIRNEWTQSQEYKQLFIDDPELAWDLMTCSILNSTVTALA